MDISIVIPAYNEENRIGITIEKIYNYFAKKNYNFEIIIVDDGSKDRTKEIVKKLQSEKQNEKNEIKLITHKKNQGKGAAVKTGILNAKGNLILFTDADLSTPIEEFEKLKKPIEDGYDIAVGSRGLPDSKIVFPQPWYRRYIGKCFPYLVRLIIMKEFKDTQCGFKLFKNSVGKSLFKDLKTEGFAFDVEILYRGKKNYKIKEVPINWYNVLESKVNLFIDPIKMIYSLFIIKIMFCNKEKTKFQ